MIRANVICSEGTHEGMWWFETLPRIGERIVLLISAPPSHFEVWRVDHIGLPTNDPPKDRQQPSVHVRPVKGF